MATCNTTSIIFDTECIGDSLKTINDNFFALDVSLCQLGKDLLSLDAFVKSLSAKDSPTIDMSFSALGYFLSADVRNNSLGTVKLGQDIPQTTKIFLTGAKISALTDVQITTPQTGQTLVWNNNRWINQTLTDNVGAKQLSGLQDVQFIYPLLDKQVLKFRASDNKWYNGPDEGILFVPDGNYVDIIVSNQGKNWNITPQAVGTPELASSAVTNPKIASLAITNEKIANNTIGLEKCAFSVGEINTGVNIGGSGAGLYVRNDEQKRLVFRKIRGTGNIAVTENENEIEIRGLEPALPPQPSGNNLGTGAGVFKDSSNYTLNFRSIKAGEGITITTNSNEITISARPVNLAISLINADPTGTPLTDEIIIGRLQLLYSPANFSVGTICRVEIQTPGVTDTNISQTVTVPFDVSYWKSGNNFQLVNPNPIPVGNDVYTQNRTLNVTTQAQNQFLPVRITRQVRTYQLASDTGFWSRIS
jgi:hypothetical protein